ncbi:unnamed protein product [Notodromas monacha]|uniref:NADH dehydrogenase [ubiquinone] 1 alpha subcomplex subunit 1 n=1 Tax=Notodromas monacha TaxID=399045 RepID=A0A7R9GHD2_9CRUS|nr:unnamed protein product [Notodromas monacha]CAG0921195.1 unnamed protein product [Notodromas monacha]
MWWECLPSFFIIIGALAVPGQLAFVVNKLAFDHKFRRDRTEDYQRMYLLRDLRLTGNYYKHEGLDALPDEPQPPAPVKEVPEYKKKNPGMFYSIT